jgi:hypothetical protein
MASTPMPRTIPKQVSFEQASYYYSTENDLFIKKPSPEHQIIFINKMQEKAMNSVMSAWKLGSYVYTYL